MAYKPTTGMTTWVSYKSVYSYSLPPSYFGRGIKEPDLPKFESTEPVVGYRVWKLNRKTFELRSCTQNTVWPSREKMVRGVNGFSVGIHAVNGFSVGIHAVKNEHKIYDSNHVGPTMADPAGLFTSEGLWSDYKADVAGEVSMWGEVKDCPDGYLSEFAYPKSLWMPESTDPLTVMQLEQNYGVPVTLRSELGPWKANVWSYMFATTPPWLTATSMIIPSVTHIDDLPSNKNGKPTDK